MCDMFKEPQGGWCGLSGVSDEEEGGGVQVRAQPFWAFGTSVFTLSERGSF